MARFRLVSGIHVNREWIPATQEQVDDDRITTVKRRGGYYIPMRQTYYASDPNNNIVESDEDLEAKFGKNKFRVADKEPSRIENPWDNLERLSTKNLKLLAEQYEVDIGDKTTKKDILPLMIAYRDGKDAPAGVTSTS